MPSATTASSPASLPGPGAAWRAARPREPGESLSHAGHASRFTAYAGPRHRTSLVRRSLSRRVAAVAEESASAFAVGARDGGVVGRARSSVRPVRASRSARPWRARGGSPERGQRVDGVETRGPGDLGERHGSVEAHDVARRHAAAGRRGRAPGDQSVAPAEGASQHGRDRGLQLVGDPVARGAGTSARGPALGDERGVPQRARSWSARRARTCRPARRARGAETPAEQHEGQESDGPPVGHEGDEQPAEPDRSSRSTGRTSRPRWRRSPVADEVDAGEHRSQPVGEPRALGTR